MTFNDLVENFKTILTQKYVEFEGRAGRKEFWYFFLVSFVLCFILGFIPVIGQLVGLALFIPSIAVGARRLHDIGKSGWLQLLGIIPIVGLIILIVWWAKEGDKEDNAFGAAPTE